MDLQKNCHLQCLGHSGIFAANRQIAFKITSQLIIFQNFAYLRLILEKCTSQIMGRGILLLLVIWIRRVQDFVDCFRITPYLECLPDKHLGCQIFTSPFRGSSMSRFKVFYLDKEQQHINSSSFLQQGKQVYLPPFILVMYLISSL